MSFRTLFVALLTIVSFVAVFTPSEAAAQDPEQTVEVTYGGWAALGGTITWASFTPVMSNTIQIILEPEDPEICEITPEKCVATFGDYTLVGLTVLGTAGLTVLGGWGTGKLANWLELDPGLGWGFAGGITGVPIFGMLWLSVPKFEPTWLNTVLGSVVTFGGAFGTGYYFSEVAKRRSHAWPEFGFGIGGTLVGSILGSIVCGDESCAATTLFGALGGMLGVGLTTFLWGTEPPAEAITTSSALQQQPIIQYGLQF